MASRIIRLHFYIQSFCILLESSQSWLGIEFTYVYKLFGIKEIFGRLECFSVYANTSHETHLARCFVQKHVSFTSIDRVDGVIITANFLFTYNSVALWTYVSYPGRCDIKLNLELGFSKGISIWCYKSQGWGHGRVLSFYTLDGTVGAEESSKLVLFLLKSVAKIR